MKQKKTMITVFLLLVFGGLYAQETVTTSGGEATGTGGTASYSVGQVVYTTNIGTNGSITQGVQQPFEISTVLGVDEILTNIEFSIYPNPTLNYLTLKTKDNTDLYYQLYDLQGKILENKKINSTITTISMENLPSTTYFLKVIKSNNSVKIFKIMKN